MYYVRVPKREIQQNSFLHMPISRYFLCVPTYRLITADTETQPPILIEGRDYKYLLNG